MADIRAAQNGDFSATSTWVGGVVPGSSDIAYANTFTVTISDTRTVQAVSNASGTGITVGGTFSLLNGCNLTCTNANGVVQGATSTSCVTTPSLGVGSSASVAASITTGNSSGSSVTHSTAGTLNWTGNLSGSSGNPGFIYQLTGTGTANITGNLVGQSLSGTAVAAFVAAGGTMNITGSVTGGSGNGGGVQLGFSSTGNITITGSVIAANTYGAINNGTGTLTVNGTCQSSTTAPAIAAGSSTQITRLSGPFLLGASGNINPVQAQSWRWAPTQIPAYMEVVASNGSTKRNLYTADNMPSGGYPVASNVRSGTVYGPSSENTGTLAVPSASSVALGVATDNTVGTAILTAANVRTAVGLASANLDTQFTNIPANVWNALTSALTTAGSVGKLLVDNVNATISSRLDSSSYTAPLDAAGTRSALGLSAANLDSKFSAIPGNVWNSLTSALTTASSIGKLLVDNVNATISSRMQPSDTLARVTLCDTTTTLTNSPNVPSAVEIADQVRVELTPELDRIDNCSTVDTTAATIQFALNEY